MGLCGLLTFFQIHLFQKLLTGIPLECQTVRIQIRPDTLPGQICVSCLKKKNQQTTKDISLAGKEAVCCK